MKLALHRLALKKVLGGMCDVNGFRSQWEVAIYNARSKLLALGHKLSPQLAIESDPSKCKELIDNAMREALADLAVSGGQE